MSASYQQYIETRRRIADLAYTSGVLSWDQETYMPSGGAALRAQQLSTLAGIVHDMATNTEYGKLLESLEQESSLDSKQKNNIRLSLRDYRRAKKYSREFVEEFSRSVSEAFNAWQEAKKKNSFSIFAPKLKKLVELKRQECELLGYEKHPYDALMDEFEPGLTTADVEMLFDEVRKELVPFVKKIAEQKENSSALAEQYFPKDQQWNFSMDVLRLMGFDFNKGRQDISMHPFTINFGASDVRVTTRIDENDLSDCVTGTIHEGGHALYEQGLPESEYGLPSGEAVSLGIHESQSRLWENQVGRSFAFWKGQTKLIQSHFPEQLKEADAEKLFEAFNVVKPSFIRVSADELTYHFHIMIRFEVEKALFDGSLEVDQIPAFWNKRYKDYLGIEVPDDASGCLQDVHWSHGSFGYFPTYSIGSFYAAQFFAQAEKAIPDLEKKIESGNFTELLNWLRENIHQYGKQFQAKELCMRITGEVLQFRHFMDYAKKKYGALYQI
jgi:carboxypeptidase Taq